MLTNYKTSDKNLVFIGTVCDEEYYINLNDDGVRGWSFMGLRPETEENLKERQREITPEDFGIDMSACGQWFDYEAFSRDMEDDWLNSHDAQAERENEEGETLYLGFGSGQDIFNYFKRENITDYESYKKHFELYSLDETTFEKVYAVIKAGQEKDTLKMVDAEKEQEKKEMVEALGSLVNA